MRNAEWKKADDERPLALAASRKERPPSGKRPGSIHHNQLLESLEARAAASAESAKFAQSAATEVADFSHTMPSDSMPSLDVPTFAAPHFMPEISHESSSLDELGVKTEALSESFEFPLAEAPQTEAALDMGSMDAHFADAKVSDDADFNFDIPTLSPEAESFKSTDFSDANSFDLTTIDLDLNDGTADKVADKLNSTPLAAEPIEIETKLDLVAAYIEMDDKEGAKELLDEVMKEGGTNQRKRAEAFLEKLA